MKRDYTMEEFRAEMRRRGVYEDTYPKRWKGRDVDPGPAAPPSPPTPTEARGVHGKTVVQIVPCGVHPLHAVKVQANGARRGCPMCEAQIEDLCRATGSEPTAPRRHAPRISLDRTRIVGCACGWRTPVGTTDSDDAYVEHAAVQR